jgi:hypothetical protein
MNICVVDRHWMATITRLGVQRGIELGIYGIYLYRVAQAIKFSIKKKNKTYLKILLSLVVF